MRGRESRDGAEREGGEGVEGVEEGGGGGRQEEGVGKRVGEGGRADIEVAQLVGLVTADRLLDVGKAGAMVHICEAGRERLVGLVRIGLRGSR